MNTIYVVNQLVMANTLFTLSLSVGVLNCLCCSFLGKCCGIPPRKMQYLMMVLAGLFINVVGGLLKYYAFEQGVLLSNGFDIAVGFLIYYLFARLSFRQRGPLAIVSAATTQAIIATIGMLCMTGNTLINNYVVQIIVPQKIERIRHTMLIFAVSDVFLILQLVAIALIFRLFAKRLPLDDNGVITSLPALICPLLLICFITAFFYDEQYGEVVMNEWGVEQHTVDIRVIFGLFVLALICLIVAVGSFLRLTRLQNAAIEAAKMEQQLASQKHFMQEADARAKSAAAFRHDLKNHFLVLEKLTEQKKYDELKKYLQSAEQSLNLNKQGEPLSDLSFMTGRTALDALLADKLAGAKAAGIDVNCFVAVPPGCQVNDFDLCTLFFNAIDNAICACLLLPAEKRIIRIDSAARGDFFIVRFYNSCLVPDKGKKLPDFGTGLQNMRRVAKQYEGALHAYYDGDFFRTEVLLGCLGSEKGSSGRID